MFSLEGLKLTALLRMKLLLRQRILGAALLLLFLSVCLSLVLARVSWVNPQKIFWDFSLASIFLINIFLAAYLSAQLFADELHRRTLHLLLSSGLSRATWLVGNFAGIALTLNTLSFIGFFFTCLFSKIFFWEQSFPQLVFSSVIAFNLEFFVVIAFTLFVSLYARPLLTLLSSLTFVFSLHSLTNLQRIFSDPVAGRFVDNTSGKMLLFIAKFFPPLEFFDLKILVGYSQQLPSYYFIYMTGLTLFWTALYLCFATFRIERMDF